MQSLFQSAAEIIQGEGADAPIGHLLLLIFGAFAVTGAGLAWRKDRRQIVSSALKLPLLPLITTVVCLPGLLMMGAVIGFELPPREVLSSILAIQAFHGVFVLSFVPVILFFGVGSSYDFMKLLNFIVFFAGGLISLGRYAVYLHEIAAASGLFLFACWAFLYCFVGCQTAWMIRPLIGSPGEHFVWRRRHGDMNFYGALAHSLRQVAKEGREPSEPADKANGLPAPQ
ncbi:MAG: hypothetical protein RLY93_14415 [Sumerlaeia bacterium]